MNYTKQAILASLLTTSITLILAYSLEQYWVGALITVGLGFLDWFGQSKPKWFWLIDLFLAGSMLLITIGALLGLWLGLLLPALLGAVATWDLGRFQQRLRDEPASEIVLQIEKRHLYLLAFALIGGAIFATIVLTFQVQLGFGVTLALGVILIISLGQIYRLLRN